MFKWIANKANDAVQKKLFSQYQDRKVWLFRAYHDLAMKAGCDEEGASKVAGLAANVLTGEPHAPDKLAALSDEQRALANKLSGETESVNEFREAGAEAAWWLSQLRLVQGTVPEKRSPTKHMVAPEAFAAALSLIDRAIELSPKSSFFATKANTYLYGLEFLNAEWAANEALSLDASNPEAKRLGLTARNLRTKIGSFGPKEFCAR